MQNIRSRLVLARIIGVIALAGLLLLAPTTATAAPAIATKPAGGLTAQWWQTFLALPKSQKPLDRCDLGTGNVIFLAGTTGGTATRTCTVSTGTSLLVPLINVECSTAEGDGETATELRACAQKDFVREFTNLSLVVDGVAVDGLTRFRVQSDPFQFTSVKQNVFGVPAATSLSVADGYWALINPLPSGTHTVSFGGDFGDPSAFTTRATYTIIVS
jgi:hypothetical protein